MDNEASTVGQIGAESSAVRLDCRESAKWEAAVHTVPAHDAAVSHPTYRPDIDGLRALAVLSVVVFHASPSALKGGFVGVDIFFVISGFLISSILFANFKQGTFSFADFYARRARRIFPALIAMLVPVGVFGWYIMTPDEFAMLGKHSAAGAGFVANIVLWLETGYFDVESDTKPLLHLWSLGVEEQFYIVWPLLLWATWRRRASFLTVGVVLALASFALNVGGISQHADAVFYLPVTRFWELLAGAGLAYTVVFKGNRNIGNAFANKKLGTLAANAASVLGLAVLVGTIVLLDQSYAFPGWWALPPVLGSVLVIAAGPQALVNRFILGNRVAVRVGLISYPLYLWHWPLLAFGKILTTSTYLPMGLKVPVVAAAFVLAYATYALVEKRLRRPTPHVSPTRNRRQLQAIYGVMVVVCLTGLAAYAGKVPARGTARDVDAVFAAQRDWDYPPRNFKKLFPRGPDFYMRAGTDPRYTLFIGDSLMEQFAVRVEQVLSKDARPHYSALFATGGGCPSVPNVRWVAEHQHPHCAAVTQTAHELARRPDVRKVVIGGDWDVYLSANSPLKYQSSDRIIPYSQPGGVEAAFAALDEQVAILSRTKQVYILLSTPKDEKFSPKSMLDGSRWTTVTRRPTTTVDIGELVRRVAPTRARLIDIATRHRAKIIDPIATLCHGTICPAVSGNGDPYFKDFEHMRPFYARNTATFIDETLLIEPRGDQADD